MAASTWSQETEFVEVDVEVDVEVEDDDDVDDEDSDDEEATQQEHDDPQEAVCQWSVFLPSLVGEDAAKEQQQAEKAEATSQQVSDDHTLALILDAQAPRPQSSRAAVAIASQLMARQNPYRGDSVVECMRIDGAPRFKANARHPICSNGHRGVPKELPPGWTRYKHICVAGSSRTLYTDGVKTVRLPAQAWREYAARTGTQAATPTPPTVPTAPAPAPAAPPAVSAPAMPAMMTRAIMTSRGQLLPPGWSKCLKAHPCGGIADMYMDSEGLTSDHVEGAWDMFKAAHGTVSATGQLVAPGFTKVGKSHHACARGLEARASTCATRVVYLCLCIPCARACQPSERGRTNVRATARGCVLLMGTHHMLLRRSVNGPATTPMAKIRG